VALVFFQKLVPTPQFARRVSELFSDAGLAAAKLSGNPSGDMLVLLIGHVTAWMCAIYLCRPNI